MLGSAELGQVGVTAGRTSPCTPEVCDAGAPVMLATNAPEIAVGTAHTCALHGGAITCWGANDVGQAGAPIAPTVPPTDVAGVWSALFDGGADGACALTGTETHCWGKALATHAPAHETPLDGALAIALGDAFGCSLDATGALACFGTATAFGNGGACGMCGDTICNNGETATTCTADCGPAPLTHLGRSYRAVAAGRSTFACGLTVSGGVECWGNNESGQAGAVDADGRLVDPVTEPFAIPGLAGCHQLAAGRTHACAVCNGTLACWGDATHGELGAPLTFDAITTPRMIAAPVAGDAWAEVTAGDGFTCRHTQIGKGYCWGTNLHGALGSGATGANLPVTVRR